MDPAGFRNDSDDNVVVCHKIVNDFPLVAEIRAGNWDPETTILEAIDCAIDNSCTTIGVESVAYQQTLKFWMETYLEMYELDNAITVIEIKPGISSKHSRIRGWVGNVLQENYHILRSEDKALILYQGIQYRAGKKDNQDDILDGCAFGDYMLNKHRDELEYQFGITPSIDKGVKARVVPLNTPMDSMVHHSGRIH